MTKQEKTLGTSGTSACPDRPRRRFWKGTAVVTGATGKLGVHLAEAVMRAGADLVAVHRRPAEEIAGPLARLASCAARCSVRFESVQADLTHLTSIPRIFEASARIGGCNLLVNAASIFVRGTLPELSDDRLQELVMTNLAAPTACCRAAIPQMRASGGGAIVNILDVGGGAVPWKRGAAYCATRAGMAMLTRCLSLELAPSIRVNALAIGLTELSPESADAQSPAMQAIPAGRPGKIDEITHAFMGLIDPELTMTGQILAVDGGRSLHSLP